MNDMLIQGWTTVSLIKLLVTLESGSRPRGGVHGISKGVPSIGGEHLRYNGTFDFSNLRYVPDQFAASMNRGRIQANDILVVKDGATTGKTAFVDSTFPFRNAVVNEHIFLCRPKPDIEPKFLFRFLMSKEGQERILLNFKGSAQGGINQSFALNTKIPMAPINEQRRIVFKLEKLLSKLDACQQRLAKIPILLKRFRLSVLAAACSGRLTADWREVNDAEFAADLFAKIQIERDQRFEIEMASAKSKKRRRGWAKPDLLSEPIQEDLIEQPSLPESWIYCRLGNLAEIVRGASPRPAGDPRYFGGSIPWITVGELTKDECVYLDEVQQFVTEEGKERSRFIKPGTLLLTNSGATLGVPKITRLGGCINDGSVALIDIPLISQLYLYYFLKSQTKQLREINQGAAQPNLNTEIVKNIITPLPPLEEQKEIVRRIEKLFTLADQIGVRFMQARQQVDQLAPSILVKAFHGELVPQNPNDEPASAMFETIRGERFEESFKKRQGRNLNRMKKLQKKEVNMLNRKDLSKTYLTEILKKEGPLTAKALWAASQLNIDDFYDQLKDEENLGLLKEQQHDANNEQRLLEVVM